MVTIGLCVTGWLIGWWLLGTPRRVGDLRTGGGRSAATGPLATSPAVRTRHLDIVIPARDEADVIALLLTDLAPISSGGRARVVVVDDHSNDRTAAVAAEFAGVEVVAAPPLPSGWTGKSWACHTGFLALRSGSPGAGHDPRPPVEVEGPEPLVFLDADVRLRASDVLDVLVEEHRRTGGLISVQPWHDTRLPYEQLSALFNVLAIMGTAMSSPAGSTGAFGPVLVTSHADYVRSGGHAAVRGQVVEDLALAARYRDAHMAVGLFEGGDDIRFRMYPAGLRQLLDGWTKNFASGAAATRPWRLVGAVVWIAGLGSGVVALLEAARGDLAPWLAATLYLAVVAQLHRMFAQVGRFSVVSALLYPLHLVCFLAVFTRSLWRTHVRHSVSWRGRVIPVGAGRD